MKVCYEARGGRKYAYRCTSKREPGKKYPTTVKEYLGVVDPETGNIIPKKVQSEAFNFTLKDRGFRTKDYGNVLLIKHVADQLGIGEDLDFSLGTASKGTLALAMAQAMAPSPFMDTQYVIGGSYIPEIVGVTGLDFSSQRLSDMTKVLGEATGCMEDLFALRAKRCSDPTFLYDITSQSTYSDMEGQAEWGHNRDGEPLKQMNLGLLTDKEGIPVAFDLFPGSISDISTLKRLVGDMKRRSPGCRLVADRGFESAANIAAMMENGIDFIVPCKINTKAVKSLVTDFSKDVMRPEHDRMHNGHVYSVQERMLGIVEEDGAFSYVTDSDPGFADAEHRVKAYVCFDSKKRSDDEQELKSSLMEVVKELDGKKARDPKERFSKRAGWMAKYLEMEVDGDGAMRISYRQNAMTFFRNRAGMFVMLTPDADWETVMTSYDARNCVEMAFDILKTELDGRRMRTGDPVRARGRFLVKFIALMIRVRMQNVISAGGIRDLTVDNALMSASNYKIIDDRGLKVRTELPKRVRQIFELFGVEDPEDINSADAQERCSSKSGNFGLEVSLLLRTMDSAVVAHSSAFFLDLV